MFLATYLNKSRKVSFTVNIYKASTCVSTSKSLFVRYIAHSFYRDITDVSPLWYHKYFCLVAYEDVTFLLDLVSELGV